MSVREQTSVHTITTWAPVSSTGLAEAVGDRNTGQGAESLDRMRTTITGTFADCTTAALLGSVGAGWAFWAFWAFAGDLLPNNLGHLTEVVVIKAVDQSWPPSPRATTASRPSRMHATSAPKSGTAAASTAIPMNALW